MMKRTYETPSVELVKFHYSDQIVAASPDGGDESRSMDETLGSSACTIIKYLFGSFFQCSTYPINT